VIALYKYDESTGKEIFLETVNRDTANGIKKFANFYKTDKGETVYAINDLRVTMEDDRLDGRIY